jgi:hypothetical protein
MLFISKPDRIVARHRLDREPPGNLERKRELGIDASAQLTLDAIPKFTSIVLEAARRIQTCSEGRREGLNALRGHCGCFTVFTFGCSDPHNEKYDQLIKSSLRTRNQ